jgi:hypothetical protein
MSDSPHACGDATRVFDVCPMRKSLPAYPDAIIGLEVLAAILRNRAKKR